MRTDEELILELHTRVAARRQRAERRKTAFLGSACGMLAMCLLALVFGGAAHPGGLPGQYAGATMLFENAGGYVLAAVIAFTLGVVITVVCIRAREKKPAQEKEEKEKK